MPRKRKGGMRFSKADQLIYDELPTRQAKAAFTRQRKAALVARLPKVPPAKKKKLLDQGYREDEIARLTSEKLKDRGLSALVMEDQILVARLMEKHKVNPLEGLLLALNNNNISTKEKIAIQKFLVPYMVSKRPELKSLDVQQDLKMSVSVNVMSFKDATQEALRPVSLPQIDAAVYDEFQDEHLVDGELVEVDE